MPIAIPGWRLRTFIRYLLHFKKYRKYDRLMAKQRVFIKAEVEKRCQESTDVSSVYIAVLVAIWRDITSDIGVEEIYLLNKIDEVVDAFYSDYNHFYTPSFS
jgi:hypothetical protein